ncbi:MAG: flagellar hook-basal body complex protein, partial [Bacteroidales bacterium]
MSLYGALFSGVSGLSAQSSAMGAISDNISNVNTTGYKGAKVNFNTLVTKQVSLTNYSPGGVQSKPRASIDVQGLLQATNSSTDVAISGQGFFVVNEAANPGNGDMFAYTRAGSFKVDKEGYMQNVSGWYMQGWPLQSWDNSLQASTVQVGNDVFMKG